VHTFLKEIAENVALVLHEEAAHRGMLYGEHLGDE
jgi:hypothetical protein